MSKASLTRNTTIRVGDSVMIEKPIRFVRCGYEFDYHAARALIVEKGLGREVNSLIEKAVGLLPNVHCYGFNERFYEKVSGALAYCMVATRARRSGIRKIFSEPLENELYEPLHTVFRIDKVKFVKTGNHKPAFVDYEGDYDPAVLCDEQTHRIVRLDGQYLHGGEDIWMEARYCRKIIL